MQLLDGQKVSQILLNELQFEVDLLNKKNIHPRLAIVAVGNDPASIIYLKRKQAVCDELGILWERFNFDETVNTEQLIAKITASNIDPTVHGILVQLPLPQSVSVALVIRAIEPRKDVDGFHAYNVGKMFLSKEFEDLVPCTPAGIIMLLEHYHIPIRGQNVTVVGASNIVGKPLSVMLLNRNATVTTCNISTRNLQEHTLKADILISAVGKPKLITADMVREEAVVVDVGINRLQNGKICGDVDFSNVAKKTKFITPVPGGIGPMTVACLMQNVVKACKRLSSTL